MAVYSCTTSEHISIDEIVQDVNQNKIHEAHEKILEFQPDTSNLSEYLILKAQIFHDLTIFDSARYFVYQIDLNPNIDINLTTYRASLFDIYGRNEDALLDYKRLVTIFAIDANNYASLAGIFYELNYLDSAEHYFHKAISLNKTEAVYYNNLASVLCKKGDTIQGIYNYSEAIRRRPNNAIYYFNRGVILVEMNKAKEALEDFNKSILLDPVNDLAYLHAAILRINNNYLDKNPCDLLKKAKDLGNRDAELLYIKMCE